MFVINDILEELNSVRIGPLKQIISELCVNLLPIIFEIWTNAFKFLFEIFTDLFQSKDINFDELNTHLDMCLHLSNSSKFCLTHTMYLTFESQSLVCITYSLFFFCFFVYEMCVIL